jgi:hypothetical protein
MGSVVNNIVEGKEPIVELPKFKLGSVITIVGQPKEANTNLATQELYELAGTMFDNFEISHLPSVNIDNEINEEEGSPFNTPEGRAAAILFSNVLSAADQAEDEAEAARYASLTPEQRQRENDEQRDHYKQMIAELHTNAEQERSKALANYFDVAQKWATYPGLTPVERCHGVAHDLYIQYGPTDGMGADGKRVQYVRTDDYGSYYNQQLVDQIQSRSIRAAKELFGQ